MFTIVKNFSLPLDNRHKTTSEHIIPNHTVDESANDPATKESEELQKLASLFREHSIENVLEISNLGDEISKWGAIPDKAQTLIPQLCRFLTAINEVRVCYGCVCVCA